MQFHVRRNPGKIFCGRNERNAFDGPTAFEGFHDQVIADFGADWKPAWERYKALHHADPQREYYMLHTDREVLDIGVIDSFGRVVPR